jgi:ABC-type uncharacterized transport system permease subunit
MKNICKRISFFVFVLFVVALTLSGWAARAMLSSSFTGEGWDYVTVELWGWQLPYIPFIRGFFGLVVFSFISFFFSAVTALIGDRRKS